MAESPPDAIYVFHGFVQYLVGTQSARGIKPILITQYVIVSTNSLWEIAETFNLKRTRSRP